MNQPKIRSREAQGFFPPDSHDHQRCQDNALARAEDICNRRGVRLTRLRRLVLELIWKSHSPIGAYDLLELLKKKKDGAAPPTVYRALDFLLSQGLIHRLESINAYIGCPHPDHQGGVEHGPFLICRNCGSAAEMEDVKLGREMNGSALERGFTVEEKIIEFKGICNKCINLKNEEINITIDSTINNQPEKTQSSRRLIEATGIRLALDKKQVLDGIDLEVHDNEIVTVIGPNGAGKTSLIRVILGLVEPDSGVVFRRRGLKIGYMPQNLRLDPSLPLPVYRFLSLTGDVSDREIHDSLEEVGASTLWRQPVQELSGGETRRVLLARALLRQPDLLVLDEPVQGVDITGQAEIYELISRTRDACGCGVLMISHDLHVVMARTDRVICLNHHVCCTGHPETVQEHPEYLALFGPRAAPAMGVYTHDHDHRHDQAGRIIPAEGMPAHSPHHRSHAGNGEGGRHG